MGSEDNNCAALHFITGVCDAYSPEEE